MRLRLRRTRSTMLLSCALSASLVAVAPAAAAEADTTRYVVLNHGRPAGGLVVTRSGESVTARYIYVDRNRGQRLETRYRTASDGRVLAGEVRLIAADGVAGAPVERFERQAGTVHWTRGTETGELAAGDDAFFRLRSTTPYDNALLARFLLSQPRQQGRLLPAGSPRATVVADTLVATEDGSHRVRFVAIDGVGPSPIGVWLDARDALFASDAGWFITVRPGAETALPLLRDIEKTYREARAAALARRLQRPLPAALVIRNGDVFDSESGVVRARTTIVVRGDRIVAVGPANAVAIPPDATVIDATGKTVVPGLWDMHTHVHFGGQTSGSLLQLAAGITTVRDLAADIDVAVSQRDRAAAGTIVSPRVVLAGFIEGPGAWAGPSEVIVGTEADALAWIARYDSLGYRQIKLYNLVHPDLVPVIAAETKRRGMRLSGHVPRGMSVAAAVRLGFDEINHAAFLFSTFFPDSLFAPTMRPYSAVAAQVAPRFDVDSREMTALIELLRAHGTVIDGTFSLWQGAGTLRGQGNPGSASYARLIKRLHDAGVTLVPGTDNPSGATYHTELELYEHAGIPAREVLRMATIIAARVMGEADEYGSIAAGKVADIVIVDGRPAERIADLRNIEHVIRAGHVYSPGELRAALGN
jgi:imidazolonepropionase-like amidohydrolase